MYHPAMTALKWTAAALVATLAFPAHADVSGPACVTDDAADIEAAMRADECLAAGDLEGEAVWLCIVKAIAKLLSEERPEGVEVH